MFERTYNSLSAQLRVSSSAPPHDHLSTWGVTPPHGNFFFEIEMFICTCTEFCFKSLQTYCPCSTFVK